MPKKCVICEADQIHGEAEIRLCDDCRDMGYRLYEPDGEDEVREVA